MHILEFTFAPWLCLVIILTCFLLAGSAGHNVFFIVWVIPLMLLALCGAFIHNQYQKGRSEEVVLGALCFTAVMAGLIVGAYAHFTSLREFWRLGQGASYFNVLPSELAAGKSDASSLVFTNTSRVDTTKTYGLVDGHSATGSVYCVAPVSAGDMAAETRVQYWAAGIDCCFPRSDFHCGQAQNEDAHGGIVLYAEERSSPLWQQAVNGAQKAYGIQAGDNYLLIKWIVDPIRHRERLWHSAVNLFLIFGGVYLLISSIVACSIMPAFNQKG